MDDDKVYTSFTEAVEDCFPGVLPCGVCGRVVCTDLTHSPWHDSDVDVAPILDLTHPQQSGD